MKCSIRKPRIAVKVVFSQHLSRQVKIITVKTLVPKLDDEV